MLVTFVSSSLASPFRSVSRCPHVHNELPLVQNIEDCGRHTVNLGMIQYTFLYQAGQQIVCHTRHICDGYEYQRRVQANELYGYHHRSCRLPPYWQSFCKRELNRCRVFANMSSPTPSRERYGMHRYRDAPQCPRMRTACRRPAGTGVGQLPGADGTALVWLELSRSARHLAAICTWRPDRVHHRAGRRSSPHGSAPECRFLSPTRHVRSRRQRRSKLGQRRRHRAESVDSASALPPASRERNGPVPRRAPLSATAPNLPT